MYLTHIGLYDGYVGIAIEEEKSNVSFESRFIYCKRGRKNSVCVLNPHEAIAIE
jgi:hypothetical protein